MENFIFKDAIPWWYFISMVIILVVDIFLYHIAMKLKNLEGEYSENFFKWMFWDNSSFVVACNFFAWGWFLFQCFRLVITFIYK